MTYSLKDMESILSIDTVRKLFIEPYVSPYSLGFILGVKNYNNISIQLYLTIHDINSLYINLSTIFNSPIDEGCTNRVVKFGPTANYKSAQMVLHVDYENDILNLILRTTGRYNDVYNNISTIHLDNDKMLDFYYGLEFIIGSYGGMLNEYKKWVLY